MVALVMEHGTKQWGLIGSKLKDRTGKQCRERCARVTFALFWGRGVQACVKVTDSLTHSRILLSKKNLCRSVGGGRSYLVQCAPLPASDPPEHGRQHLALLGRQVFALRRGSLPLPLFPHRQCVIFHPLSAIRRNSIFFFFLAGKNPFVGVFPQHSNCFVLKRLVRATRPPHIRRQPGVRASNRG